MRQHAGAVLGYGFGIGFVIAALWTTTVSWGCDKSVTQPSIPIGPESTPPPGPSGGSGPSGPTGSYALTVTASTKCVAEDGTIQALSLPNSVRMRRYDAEFAKGAATLKSTDGTGNEVQIGGVGGYYAPGKTLMIAKEGELTIFVLPVDGRSYWGALGCDIDGFSWHETVSGGDLFSLCGTWRGAMADPSHIEGTITGTFAYYPDDSDLSSPLTCYATDHHFTLSLKAQSSAR